MKKGVHRFKELFWYSDSEPNEVLIALCHIIALPAALCIDFENPSILLILGGVMAGAFQLWSVLWDGTLRMRLYAVQLAALVAIVTVENLAASRILSGSRVGWVIICFFAIWNTVRVYKEKLDKGL